mmetsp:Transcript_23964/g.66622  ORF Transcript_23964/g.66622 Transcript_23964/m.66622 type:complete len:220 (+) Transcript_23964:178-837(+)
MPTRRRRPALILLEAPGLASPAMDVRWVLMEPRPGPMQWSRRRPRPLTRQRQKWSPLQLISGASRSRPFIDGGIHTNLLEFGHCWRSMRARRRRCTQNSAERTTWTLRSFTPTPLRGTSMRRTCRSHRSNPDRSRRRFRHHRDSRYKFHHCFSGPLLREKEEEAEEEEEACLYRTCSAWPRSQAQHRVRFLLRKMRRLSARLATTPRTMMLHTSRAMPQ